MVKTSDHVRCSKKFKILVNKVRSRYILNGKKPPSISKITDKIAEKIQKNGEGELLNEFIQF